MTAVFRLIHITGGPGAFEQHHVTGPVKRESQATGPVGGQQQIRITALKPVHRVLALLRFLPAGQQFATEVLLQQLKRAHKGTEQNNGLPRAA